MAWEQYVIVGIIIFFFNLLPAFTPPTWMLLTAFHIKYNLVLFPLVITGALAATGGRACLALLAKKLIRPFLSQKSKENLGKLGKYLNQNTHITIPLILTYAFLPFPSNQIFVAAGLANVYLPILSFSFFIGRLISYTFWVATSNLVADNIFVLLQEQTGKTTSILLEILGFLMLVFLIKFDWSTHVIKHIEKRKKKSETH